MPEVRNFSRAGPGFQNGRTDLVCSIAGADLLN